MNESWTAARTRTMESWADVTAVHARQLNAALRGGDRGSAAAELQIVKPLYARIVAAILYLRARGER